MFASLLLRDSRATAATAAIAARPGMGTAISMLPVPCIFCDVRSEKGFRIVFEDDELVVFTDINPASSHHLQVVPKNHIDNVRSLCIEDVALVRRMKAAGNKALDMLGVPSSPDSRRLGFHIPPYISIGHLHMHVQGLPFKSMFRGWRYPVRTGNGRTTTKGFSMFADVDQTLSILESGGRVKIGSC
ncbi:HIT-like protein [Auriculariales sp. MPI-PUGE-AT-0066]|nr:HIT-like protein [Auriculariales sp. MPI-PUGE-AT-0066]